ncbi:MAG: phosphoribosylformylglycinamidine synthase subunit PurQ [Bdellovibrionales bacterium]|nr:phosphoribosylformylglycinamidine synthase subunit PurQ [Bdellovibrionales bacterium]
MKPTKKVAWVLTGDGINCEVETAEACRAAGFETTIFHMSELIAKPRSLEECSLLVIPGGFSFGDELGSGRVLALKIRRQLGWDLPAFARAGGLVLGICNGFQALVALGVFGEGVALAANADGRFRNEWCRLEVDPAARKTSPFLDALAEIDLPIRHGEGRLLFAETSAVTALRSLPALRYSTNPNGSTDRIAGLCDETGRIFGLMPHPEGFQRASQHPGYFRDATLPDGPAHPLSDGAGLALFTNAFRSAKPATKESP